MAVVKLILQSLMLDKSSIIISVHPMSNISIRKFLNVYWWVLIFCSNILLIHCDIFFDRSTQSAVGSGSLNRKTQHNDRVVSRAHTLCYHIICILYRVYSRILYYINCHLWVITCVYGNENVLYIRTRGDL